MKTHELKCWPEPFTAIECGVKSFELRRDDRGFEVNDRLWLREWDEASQAYTSRSLRVFVKYILRGPRFGLPEGFVVMSIERLR